ncbi:Dihydroxyacetone phosphate acyltransferase [Dirofilaria immitis]|nr:Dihydroxyacetone phosphate acyltransferase [Dirofilaria immitis]
MNNRLENGMMDWLQIIDKAGGEIAWITQPKNFPRRNDRRQKQRNSNEIIEMILKTESVQQVIKEECAKRNTTRKLLSDESRLILRSMAHQMQLLVIRSVGYVITKTIRTVYDGVYFNDGQLLRIREYSKSDPIIFMPTHRDALYWSLFSNYVQMQLCETDNPIEFFLEGARSRSGKSLYPKFGLLQMCLEPFFRCRIYDLIVVPVTIDYDKILEEFLYAYELFGFPKPQETTTGLFKSREILNKRFGHIYVNFGEPISMRKYFNGRINRWHPPWQNSNSTVTVWPYTCAILLQVKSVSHQKLIFSELQTYLEDFVALIIRMGRQIIVRRSIADDLRFATSAGHNARYYLKLHSDLFQYNTVFHNSLIELKRFKCVENNGLKKNYLEEMLCETILSHYANQEIADAIGPNLCSREMYFFNSVSDELYSFSIEDSVISFVADGKILFELQNNNNHIEMMHDFVDVSLLCHILLSNQALSRANHIFRELRSLFAYEFVCSLQEEEIDELFTNSLNCLVRISAISLNDDYIILKEEQILEQIAFLMQPFIVRYYFVMQSLAQLVGTHFTNEVLFENSLQLAINLYAKQQGNNTLHSVSITSDVTRNVLSAFCSLQNEREYDVNVYRLRRMMELLESISMELETIPLVASCRLCCTIHFNKDSFRQLNLVIYLNACRPCLATLAIYLLSCVTMRDGVTAPYCGEGKRASVIRLRCVNRFGAGNFKFLKSGTGWTMFYFPFIVISSCGGVVLRRISHPELRLSRKVGRNSQFAFSTEMVRTKAGVRRYDVSSSPSNNNLIVEEQRQKQKSKASWKLMCLYPKNSDCLPVLQLTGLWIAVVVILGMVVKLCTIQKTLSTLQAYFGFLWVYRARVRALKEIRKYQKSTKLLIRKLPFAHLVKEIANEVSDSSVGYRFAVEAVAALQELIALFTLEAFCGVLAHKNTIKFGKQIGHAISNRSGLSSDCLWMLECNVFAAEAFMVQFFENAFLCSQHAKRITVMPRDIQLVRRLFDI